MKLIVAYVQTPLPSGKIDIHSDEFSLECGMPQGSCLGPILFMLCSVGSLLKPISLEFIVMQTIHRFTFVSYVGPAFARKIVYRLLISDICLWMFNEQS